MWDVGSIPENIGAHDEIAISLGRGASIPDDLTLRGHVRVDVYGPDGTLKDFRESDNLIVTVGKNGIADQLVASPTISKPGWMAVGTGSTAPAAGDTALGTEIDRNALTSKTRSTNVVTMVGDWAAGDATNAALAEAGIFDASSAGTMYARATFTAINKGASDTLSITWTFTVG
jgi:hypothetical protein